jgi:tetratricopeptide (TPR) repeat protein
VAIRITFPDPSMSLNCLNKIRTGKTSIMRYQDLCKQAQNAFLPEEAIRLYRESLWFYDASDNQAWVGLATRLNEMKEYSAALDATERYIGASKNPIKFMGWFQRGVALAGLGYFEKAIVCYDIAIAFDPGFTAKFYLGRASAKQSLGYPYADDIESAKKYS